METKDGLVWQSSVCSTSQLVKCLPFFIHKKGLARDVSEKGQCIVIGTVFTEGYFYVG